MSNENNFK